jgi:hypothetical protein
VKLFPTDATGCGSYRMREPARAVGESSANIDTLIVFDDENPEHQLDVILTGHLGSDLRVTRVADPCCDVIVLQRPMYRTMIECIPFLQEHGVSVVVELDDNFHRIHPQNPAFALTKPEINPDTNIVWLEKALSLADLIVVSTPALAKFYGDYGPIRVVRNYVPASTVRESAPVREDVVFGWTGTTTTHAGDLDTIGSAVSGAMRSVPSSFHTIGDRRTPAKLGVEGVVQEWLPIDELPTAIDAISIGMVPLAINEFNAAKSYIKGLEFAARGIPFVASPTSEYEYLAGLGAGTLARTERKWQSTLTQLASDSALRLDRAEAALRAAKQLTIEEHVGEWCQAWADARTMKR